MKLAEPPGGTIFYYWVFSIEITSILSISGSSFQICDQISKIRCRSGENCVWIKIWFRCEVGGTISGTNFSNSLIGMVNHFYFDSTRCSLTRWSQICHYFSIKMQLLLSKRDFTFLEVSLWSWRNHFSYWLFFHAFIVVPSIWSS